MARSRRSDPIALAALVAGWQAGGLDLNAPFGPTNGSLLLELAVLRGELAFVRALLAAGADPMQRGALYEGNGALCGAVRYNETEAVLAMLATGPAIPCGADLRGIGRTLAHDAAANANLVVLEALMEQGLDLHQPDHHGLTPWRLLQQHAPELSPPALQHLATRARQKALTQRLPTVAARPGPRL